MIEYYLTFVAVYIVAVLIMGRILSSDGLYTYEDLIMMIILSLCWPFTLLFFTTSTICSLLALDKKELP